MARQADWYFDYVSPYAYLQLEAFDRLPADLEITIKPVLFAGLLGYWLFAELPYLWSVAGAALIVGSNFYIVRHEQVHARRQG